MTTSESTTSESQSPRPERAASAAAAPAHDWQGARLRAGRLEFATRPGIRQALQEGVFFVEEPAELSLAAGDRFAQRFYLPGSPDDPYRGFARWTADRLADHEGYYQRDDDQTEQFFLERRFWDALYPGELVRQAAAMQEFALAVLAAVLVELDLPAELWDEATGRCLSGRGTYHLTFNHFRPHVRARGLNVHKDSGWVTVLRSVDPGLEVGLGPRWVPIAPRPGHFIVNFGCAMEILMRDSRTPVAAVAHRVVEQPDSRGQRPDRFSYALFVDSSLDETVCPGLFRYRAGVGLELAMRFQTFLEAILRNTYQKDTSGLY